jgi:hypothetical protein
LRASPIGFSRFQRLELRLRLYSRGKSSPQYTPPQVSSGKFGLKLFSSGIALGEVLAGALLILFMRDQVGCEN